MGVTAGHLRQNSVQDLCHREFTVLLGDLAVENDLEKDVSKLLRDVIGIALVKGLEGFVGFLDQIRLEGGASLLAIPGAAALTPEAVHQGEQGFEENAGGVCHERCQSRGSIIHKGGWLLEGLRDAC